MIVYECLLEIMENLQYASTEIGKKYITLGLIGNTALPYALNLVQVNYNRLDKPMHREHFKQLNEMGIYITPATFLGIVDFKQERFNCQPDRYNLTWKSNNPEKSGARGDGYPDEGYWQMLCRGNKATFYIISQNDDECNIPTYVRLGKFNSKCKITAQIVEFDSKSGTHQTDLLLRAEDLVPSLEILQYDKIPIQHGMYLQNVTFRGKGYLVKSNCWDKDSYPILPADMSFYNALQEVTA